ncbi:MAG: lipoyl synthase [Elusimicrobiota bacterium]
MSERGAFAPARLPGWLKVRLAEGRDFERIKAVSARRGLHTVCEQARCPNIGECWNGEKGTATATFMILGKDCTRACRFCSVSSKARPDLPDPDEPKKLAQTLLEMGLDYAVITTVCRDDLPDQGAGHVAAVIREIKSTNPRMILEILMQDFRGDESLLAAIAAADPNVLAHNIETIERLTPLVRDRRASYRQSLDVLSFCRAVAPGKPTKSSIMLGLGEKEDEVFTAFEDLRKAGTQILTIGQYLRPSRSGRNLPVEEFIHPDRFEDYGRAARDMGFLHVASGPFVRSSYRAGELFMKGYLGAHHDG